MGIRQVVTHGRRTFLSAAAVVGLWASLSGAAFAGSITLAWDPNPEPDITAYRVFVGTAPGVYTQSFDIASDRNTFTFTSAAAGVRYYFAVAAQAADLVFGPVSAEVWSDGRVASSLTQLSERSALEAGGVSTPGSLAGSARSASVSVVTSSAGEIAGLTVLPQGGLMYVENGTRVVSRPDGTGPITLMQADKDERILQAALDPQYSTNGFVYVSVAHPNDNNGAEIDIVRQRYAGGALGEPAVIVPTITAPEGRTAPFLVSDDGLIYVAAPSGTGRRDPYAASVLVLDRDGRVPADQTPATPVIATGFEAPLAMAWDPVAKRAWLAGRSGGDGHSLKTVRRNAVPATAASDDRLAAAVMAALLDQPATGVATAGETGATVVATEKGLVVWDGGSWAAPARIDLSAYGAPTGVAVGTAGEIYVVVRPTDGSSGSLVLKMIMRGSSTVH